VVALQSYGPAGAGFPLFSDSVWERDCLRGSCLVLPRLELLIFSFVTIRLIRA